MADLIKKVVSFDLMKEELNTLPDSAEKEYCVDYAIAISLHKGNIQFLPSITFISNRNTHG